jgi:hypothetical protein
MRLYLVIFILFSAFSTLSFGQLLEGKVLDTLNQPIFNATVLAYDGSKQDRLDSYAITDMNGAFSIELKTQMETFFLKINHISYSSSEKKFHLPQAKPIIIFLKSDTQSLQEIIIERPRIYQKKDTITYNVSSFKKETDNVIGDVIAKLPGIEVTTSGQIKYQGEPIEKFYIEGLDLLEDRYNIANKNLRAVDISEIQILENHQPIKFLDSITTSDRTSINLKLKNNNTKNIILKGALGAKPLLGEIEITPLFFSPKGQSISSYKFNNTGINIKEDLNRISTDFFVNSERNIASLLNTPRPKRPLLAQKFWLDNTSHLITYNHIKKIKNDNSIKIYGSYFTDVSQEFGNKQTEFLNSGEETIINENTTSTLKDNYFQTGIVYEQNNTKAFFKNKLDIDYQKTQEENILNNSTLIRQQLNQEKTTIKNEATLILGKKNIFEFDNVLQYTVSPEQLVINDDSIQKLEQQWASLKQGIKTSFLLKNLQITPYTLLNIETENLSSDLVRPIFDSDINDTKFNKTSVTAGNEFIYQKNKTRIIADLPIIYYNLKLSDNNGINNSRNSFIRFEPNFRVIQTFSNKWKGILSSNIKNYFGNSSNLYSSPVLINYRTVQSYITPIPEQKSLTIAVNIQNKNIRKGTFTYFVFSYNNSTSNTTISSTVENNGDLNINALDNPANTALKTFNLRHSKDISSLNSLLTINLSGSLLSSEEKINNTASEIKNSLLNLNTSLEFSGLKNILISYSNRTNYNNIISNDTSNSFWFITQRLSTTGILKKHGLSLHFDATTLINDTSTTNLIGGINYFYNSKNPNKPSFYVRINNLFNESNYVNQTNSPVFTTLDSYILRPRQFIFGFSFSL